MANLGRVTTVLEVLPATDSRSEEQEFNALLEDNEVKTSVDSREEVLASK